MKQTKMTLAIAAFVFLILFLMSFFTINQGQHALLLRLGKLVMNDKTHQVKIISPGLHVKWPFIENIRVFDTRIQTLDIKSSRIVTKEKKDVIVDYYVKWRIDNLAQYFTSTSGIQFKAESLLEQQLNTYLRDQFGKRTISDVVSGERNDFTQTLNGRAEEQAAQLGIHVVDVRIKGIELPANTSNTVFQLMRANMQKIANRHRADGHAVAETIQSAADAKVTILLAKARSEAQMIRSQGRAKAANIYADAYSKNREFFSFYRSLKAYMNSFKSKQDILVLDQGSAFFNYFKQGLAKNNTVEVKH